MALSMAGVFALSGIERSMAVGAFGASAVGALLALTQLRGRHRLLLSWMRTREADLSTFADDRAAAVARQFAWAVDELVDVRAELRRVEASRAQAEEVAAATAQSLRQETDQLIDARAKLATFDPRDIEILRSRVAKAELDVADHDRAKRSAERRAQVAEQRSAELARKLRLVASTVETSALVGRSIVTGPLTFDWTLEYDGSFHTLRIRCMTPEIRPAAARVLDAGGRPIAESPSGRQRRSATLHLRIPQSVAGAVETGDWTAFRLEVLVDDVWRGALLVDRGRPVVGASIESEASQPRAIRVVN